MNSFTVAAWRDCSWKCGVEKKKDFVDSENHNQELRGEKERLKEKISKLDNSNNALTAKIETAAGAAATVPKTEEEIAALQNTTDYIHDYLFKGHFY